MNVLKTKLWAVLAAMLTLVACGDDLSTPAETTKNTSEVQTKQVFANLSAGTADGVRALFGVPDASTGKIAGLLMSEENDLMVRVAVKQGEDGIPVCQTLKFTKIPGRNYASYSGQITVPDGGSGQYKIAAIVMSEVDKTDETIVKKTYGTVSSDDPTSVSFHAIGANDGIKTVSNSQIELNVPYATKWSSITIPDTGAADASLMFNPIGTILRVRIHNQSSSAKTISGFRIASEAASLRGVGITFSETYENGPKLYPFNSPHIDYVLSPGVSVEANQYSPWLYVWMMPRRELKTSTPYTVLSIRHTSNVVVKSLDLYQPLTAGSVAITLPLTQANADGQHTSTSANFTDMSADDGTTPKLPVEYITPYALNADKSGFVNDYQTDNSNVGWFSYYDIQNFTSPVTIVGNQYSLPTADEMAGIFPRNLDLTHTSSTKVGYDFTDVGEYSIRINGITQNYRADYARVSNTVSCAIRFKNSSNRYRTAFRYSVVTIGTSNAIKVECVHLGASSSATIATVKQESFWTTNQANIKSAIFPCYGFKYGIDNNPFTNRIHLFTSSLLTPDEGYIAHVQTGGTTGRMSGGLYATGLPNALAPIYLFKRN